MGTFAKRLGQLAARSLESESSNILTHGSANKTGLSFLLDATLRKSHDMRVFGLGTAASMASLPRYTRFTQSMHAVYAAMEEGLDGSPSPAVAHVWRAHGGGLRRRRHLEADLVEAHALMEARGMLGPLGGRASSLAAPHALSPATAAYVERIRAAAAADRDTGGGRLLGHLYCRYFADLFGGQALAKPYRWALGLGAESPQHYDFGAFISGAGGGGRRAAIEGVYEALNEAGARHLGSDAQREEVVAEARAAFGHNVRVYKEGGGLLADGAIGAARVASGFVRAHLPPRS